MHTETTAQHGIRLCSFVLVVSLPVAVSHQLSAQAVNQPAPSITRTGCLVEEATFAQATGLAQVGAGARAGQLVFTDRSGSASVGTALAVTGEREQELVPHTHVVVEITGVLEGASPSLQTTPPASGVALPPQRSTPEAERAASASSAPSAEGRTPSGAAGVTPRGTAAHEPGDATERLPGAGGDVPPDAESAASTPSDVIAIADLPRLNVRTFRVVGGSCADSLLQTASTDAPQSVGAAPVPPTRTATLEQVTVTGCVIREADTGSGTTGAPPGGLLLIRATRGESRTAQTSGGAVPGSLPSGGGTGTVAPRARPPRPADSSATDALTFTLEERGQDPQDLAALVGQRVSIEGTLRTGTAAQPTPSAHSTAPAGTLLVASVRRIAGDCR
jgi:hypothetical protein